MLQFPGPWILNHENKINVDYSCLRIRWNLKRSCKRNSNVPVESHILILLPMRYTTLLRRTKSLGVICSWYLIGYKYKTYKLNLNLWPIIIYHNHTYAYITGWHLKGHKPFYQRMRQERGDEVRSGIKIKRLHDYKTDVTLVKHGTEILSGLSK